MKKTGDRWFLVSLDLKTEITNSKTHWEWFSLRFFDDEEMMLFTFPQDGYYDGTYITKSGQRERLQDYTIKSTSETKAMGLRWSSSWDLYVNKKEERYKIIPIQEGHMNFAYFEELCYIKNARDEVVGYCFVELLPGVLNGRGSKTEPGEKRGKIKLSNLFKRIEC